MFAVINKENNNSVMWDYQPHALDGEGLEGESDQPEIQSKSVTEQGLKPGSLSLLPFCPQGRECRGGKQAPGFKECVWGLPWWCSG